MSSNGNEELRMPEQPVHAAPGVGDYNELRSHELGNQPSAKEPELHPEAFTTAKGVEQGNHLAGKLLATEPDNEPGTFEDDVDMMMQRSRH